MRWKWPGLATSESGPEKKGEVSDDSRLTFSVMNMNSRMELIDCSFGV